MVLDKDEQAAFKEAVKPLMKWLNENCTPHVTVLVTPTDAELLEGVVMARFHTNEFVIG